MVVLHLATAVSLAGSPSVRLGLPPDVASWGGRLSWEGRRYMERVPALALWPGFSLFIVVWGTNIFGDALRDLLNPSLRGGGGRYGAAKTKRALK